MVLSRGKGEWVYYRSGIDRGLRVPALCFMTPVRDIEDFIIQKTGQNEMTARSLMTGLAVLACLIAAPKAQSEETLPLWEVAVTGVAVVSPDYPGSDEYQYLALPVPTFRYRGEFLRIDRQGLRGIFVETDNLELDVSLDGNLPTDDDNDAREGMPDLDPLIEIGPSLKYRFYRSGETEAGVQLPLRVALSVFGDDDFIDYRGLVINPELTLNTSTTMDGRDVRLGFSAGPLFGYDGINEYFYQVDPQFTRSGRTAYEAGDGYMGSEITGSISFSINERWRYFAAGNITYSGGASNEDSPLFEDDFNAAFATGITWSFYQSERRVPVRR